VGPRASARTARVVVDGIEARDTLYDITLTKRTVRPPDVEIQRRDTKRARCCLIPPLLPSPP